ncbi:hypothetical protein E2C01_089573 [Portunus trituberculatus]|uniref:Uncharacterized protein n=1 Tax=Portunus trituberculatus TaxID=210409 RepID=A0A5B7JIL5_PORTR|nr:hypothetical protein [Portunus trituberculatus]
MQLHPLPSKKQRLRGMIVSRCKAIRGFTGNERRQVFSPHEHLILLPSSLFLLFFCLPPPSPHFFLMDCVCI